MKGDAIVLDYLNRQLKNELTAINQYFLHCAHAARTGASPGSAKHEYEESIEEMKHADIADRARAVPRGPAQPAGPRQAADRRERAPRCLQCDLKLELGGRRRNLKEAIAYCESVRDYVIARACSKTSSRTPRSTSTT
ncbi:MAG: bacterioferritin [Comamonadaceae bacterium]|nr:bacterioferritin [Comamonadaceae bacterium]